MAVKKGKPIGKYLLTKKIDDILIHPRVTKHYTNFHSNLEQIRNCVGYAGDFSFNVSKPDGTMKKLTRPLRF